MSEKVKPGYKQTEVGVIPEEWEVSTFNELFYVTAGGDVDPKRSASDQDETHCYPIYSNALTNRGLYGYCSYADHQAGSITITARGTLGFANFRDHSYTAIGRVLVLQPKNEIVGSFFADLINHRVKFAIESTGVPQLTAPQISIYRLPVPPLPEQRAIAGALSDVDALIVALDSVLSKKRDLKQAAMQQLLTGQTRLPGFHGEWEVKRLGDVADVDPENLGSSTAPDYEFNYISLEDVDAGVLRSSAEQVFRSAPSRARRKLQKGDILVSTVRPNLKSHLLFTIDALHWVCSTGFAIVRCREGLTHPGYVFSNLFGHSVSQQIDALLTGSNYPAINSSDVRALRIPLPGFPEQTAIAEVLSDMDAELAALTQRRDKTRALKQGMMQELLTGRTRLI